MRSTIQEISDRLRLALTRLGMGGADPAVTRTQDERFGDYQSNCPMVLARTCQCAPREFAERLLGLVEWNDLCEPAEIAGPGFINLRLKREYGVRVLTEIPSAPPEGVDRLGLSKTNRSELVVVDLSSPNLAKEMHVGHLRSTVIGDSIARILEFAGHVVHRENHVGDWGTQFGMLVAYLRQTAPEVEREPERLAIADLERFYVEAKERFDEDEAFRNRSRQAVVDLQRGEPVTRMIWKAFCDESLRHCHEVYERLGVRLEDRGESFYNELMGTAVARLEERRRAQPEGLVRESDGALCVFLDGFQTRDGTPLPLIVRKSDGGFNYATSDLATLIHRIEQLRATRIVYVVGASQKQHFDMLFSAVRALGWAGPGITLEHLGFGNMLAESGRPFKTREGGTVKLKGLLDEAVHRAAKLLSDRTGTDDLDETGDPRRGDPPLSSEEQRRIAETVGMAAIKYYDLSHALQSDYRFDLDRMLSLEGNTAPYMLYAYARIQSIIRKAGAGAGEFESGSSLVLEHPSEWGLAKEIMRLPEIMDQLVHDLRPNVLTDYLFELSRRFSRFYDRKLGVRVIDCSPESLRRSRLRLCDLTARVLRLGLGLLGIDVLERM